MSWQKEVDEINKRRRLARALGGPEAIARHHELGKLTLRERIAALLDENSFREQGAMAGAATLDDDGEVANFDPANYILGAGAINGRPVVVGGEDFTLKGGSPNAAGYRKSVYAEHLAIDMRAPLVRLMEGGGGSVAGGGGDPKQPRTVGEPPHLQPRLQIIAEAMSKVPIASAALGPVAGLPAARLVASHFRVMTQETAQVLIAGPAVVERALGVSLSKQELGGPAVHLLSGVVDNVAVDEYDALRQIRTFLSFFPQHAWQSAPRTPCSDPVDRCENALLSLVPRDRRATFDMHELIAGVVDQDSFFEYSASYGPSLITGYARLNGQSVGILANDCRFFAGAMSADGAEKTRRFIETCDSFHIPIVTFIDEPGFMIGPEAERAGTIRYGMATCLAAAASQVPWASVMVHKSFGVATTAHFAPDNYVLSWPSVASGALPVEGGVAVAFRRVIAAADNPEQKRKELEDQLASARSPYPAAESFAVNDLIDPRETRPMLCQWVEDIQPRLQTLTTPVSFGFRP
ncbi:propionyl-CoA carboxylase [Halieaceae bacterium IMCC14734]|uniref:Propionyl-CoA carboxylase n=1 Tax=Candidatus Litorirhabdus singularis TaxID=2518993 RepID=A0ABT3TB19_9GAMM|nr:carboxyl transferase domain-containing protein [Candidatus Litorirhabdus singularis]MCX2979450.1 propionyl-CoA carboxylase [Candidatus Litorirhabdus singularis]